MADTLESYCESVYGDLEPEERVSFQESICKCNFAEPQSLESMSSSELVKLFIIRRNQVVGEILRLLQNKHGKIIAKLGSTMIENDGTDKFDFFDFEDDSKVAIYTGTPGRTNRPHLTQMVNTISMGGPKKENPLTHTHRIIYYHEGAGRDELSLSEALGEGINKIRERVRQLPLDKNTAFEFRGGENQTVNFLKAHLEAEANASCPQAYPKHSIFRYANPQDKNSDNFVFFQTGDGYAQPAVIPNKGEVTMGQEIRIDREMFNELNALTVFLPRIMCPFEKDDIITKPENMLLIKGRNATEVVAKRISEGFDFDKLFEQDFKK